MIAARVSKFLSTGAVIHKIEKTVSCPMDQLNTVKLGSTYVCAACQAFTSVRNNI
jgi:hypothetical protein